MAFYILLQLTLLLTPHVFLHVNADTWAPTTSYVTAIPTQQTTFAYTAAPTTGPPAITCGDSWSYGVPEEGKCYAVDSESEEITHGDGCREYHENWNFYNDAPYEFYGTIRYEVIANCPGREASSIVTAYPEGAFCFSGTGRPELINTDDMCAHPNIQIFHYPPKPPETAPTSFSEETVSSDPTTHIKVLTVKSTITFSLKAGTGRVLNETEMSALVDSSTRFFGDLLLANQAFQKSWLSLSLENVVFTLEPETPNSLQMGFVIHIHLLEGAAPTSREAAKILAAAENLNNYLADIASTESLTDVFGSNVLRVHFRGVGSA